MIGLFLGKKNRPYFQISLKFKGIQYSLKVYSTLVKEKNKCLRQQAREGPTVTRDSSHKACTFGACPGQLFVLNLQKPVVISEVEAADVLRETGQGGGSGQTLFQSYFFP